MTKIPDGSEKGLFLAVDLGGTNCRVCAVNLHGDSTLDVFQEKHAVPADIRVNSSSRPLFQFIAAKIQDFLQDFAQKYESSIESSGYYRLGFTFSFTCEQTSIARGTLVHWDKGWDIPDALGKDPCALLQDAIDDIGVPVRVCVLANDAVGTLLARAYTAGTSSSTLAGIILGTGTNAAYIEKISKIERLTSSAKSSGEPPKNGFMVINTEWGSWDDDIKAIPQTTYDKLIDAASSDPGSGLLEKRVSGMYLGELMRLAMLELMRSGAFDMVIGEESRLHKAMGIDSSFLSDVTTFETREFENIKSQVSKSLSASGVSFKDTQTIQMLASVIVTRSATLVAASLAAIVIQSGRLNPIIRSPKAQMSESTVELSQKPAHSSFSKLLSSVSRFGGRILSCILPSPELSKIPDYTSYRSKDTISSLTEVDDIDIGVDGSLFEFHPKFESILRSALRDIPEIGLAGEQKISIRLTKDGSGTGAALIAAVAHNKID